MCVIINAKQRSKVSEDLVLNNFGNAGAGILYRDEDGEIQSVSGLTSKGALLRALDSVPADSQVAIHLRTVKKLSADARYTQPVQIGDTGRYLLQAGLFAKANKPFKASYSETHKIAAALAKLTHGEQNIFFRAAAGRGDVAFVTGTDKGLTRWGKPWVKVSDGVFLANTND